jgi:signal transduction histidine kinase
MSEEDYINFQELNPFSSKCNKIIDEKLKKDLNNSDFIAYRYIDNSYEISVPIIVEGVEIASLVLGKFFYEGETANVEFFRNQALEFGFNEDEYVKALKNVPIFSREKVINIIECYRTLVITLAESNIAKLKYKHVNSKYIRLLNSIQDFVFMLDSSTRLIEYNKSLDENLYIHVGEFIGKKLNEVLPKNIGDALDDALYKVRNGDIIQTINCSVIINGKEMWFSAQVSKLISDEISDCDSYIVVTRNITENVNMMDELQKAKLQAEEANNAKNTFVANISHELKTPITVIQSATQLFEMKVKNMEGIDKNYHCSHIRTIKQNCRRLLRLINNLIDVTKVDAGFMRLQLQNLNIVRLVEKITNSVAEYAKAKRINVTFSKSIKELTITVDPDKVERILFNLLSNAIKFTEAGGNIIVSIYATNEDIYISVKDTGIGIPSGKLDMIFERFNNIDNILSRNHEGSGIGLSLAKSFAELHGGKISVKSKLGNGSEFTVKLPIIELNSNQLDEYQNYIVDSNIYSDRLNVEFSDIYM